MTDYITRDDLRRVLEAMVCELPFVPAFGYLDAALTADRALRALDAAQEQPDPAASKDHGIAQADQPRTFRCSRGSKEVCCGHGPDCPCVCGAEWSEHSGPPFACPAQEQPSTWLRRMADAEDAAGGCVTAGCLTPTPPQPQAGEPPLRWYGDHLADAQEWIAYARQQAAEAQQQCERAVMAEERAAVADTAARAEARNAANLKEQLEKAEAELSAKQAEWNTLYHEVCDQRDALQARLDAAARQEPVAWVQKVGTIRWWSWGSAKPADSDIGEPHMPLYAAPVPAADVAAAEQRACSLCGHGEHPTSRCTDGDCGCVLRAGEAAPISEEPPLTGDPITEDLLLRWQKYAFEQRERADMAEGKNAGVLHMANLVLKDAETAEQCGANRAFEAVAAKCDDDAGEHPPDTAGYFAHKAVAVWARKQVKP